MRAYMKSWLGRVGWLGLLGLLLLSGPSTFAQTVRDLFAVPDVTLRPDLTLVAQERSAAWWIGVICQSADPALRAQLKLADNEGLVVTEVSPGSPAANAGLKANDVLLRANGNLVSELSDLAAVVSESKGEEVKLQLLRSGEKQTISVKPAPRPADAVVPVVPENTGPWDGALRRWMQQLGPGGNRNFNMRFFHPGVVVPPGAPLLSLPADMSITIHKEGGKPARITVKKGEQVWDVSENDLGELASEARTYVERMLGRLPEGEATTSAPAPAPAPSTTVSPDGSKVEILIPGEVPPNPKPIEPAPAGKVPATEPAKPVPPKPTTQANPTASQLLLGETSTEARVQKRLDEVTQRVDQLLRAVEELQKQNAAAPKK